MPIAKVDDKVVEQTTAEKATTFFVLLKSSADVGRAASLGGHADRTRYVFEEKKAHAERTQAGLRALLAERKAAATPFWIINAIKVTGAKKLMLELAGRAEVARIVPDQSYRVVQPVRREPRAGTRGAEWNVEQVRAPAVWQAYGAKGEGVVVGTIDTGAQYDHPALARQYRGASGGIMHHEYSWFDPSRICGDPQVPCDNVGHGTHVLGTVLGDDGQGNQTGIAPGAQWIAAKGCESNDCSASALLASGQWMVAPTDAKGNNPRPDLAPHVINNSWSGPTAGDPFFRQVVDTWAAAGIMPVFANGNDGPNCRTARSPGDVANSVAVGAFDQNGAIAGFSSRGPGGFDEDTKPDVAAPGVNVRSSVPGGGYEAWSGTSMAAPHVTGAVALAWSAAPVLRGQLETSRELLLSAAVPAEDPQCGGTPTDNNVWGRGKLDAMAAATNAPRGPTGALTGTVRSDTVPLADAEITAEGPLSRTTRTNAQGEFSLPYLPAGQYTVTASRFGYLKRTTRVVIVAKTTVSQIFELAVAPRHTVSGHVRDDANGAVAGAKVSVRGEPLDAAITDTAGAYQLTGMPEGTLDLVAERVGCLDPQRLHVTVDGDETVDFTLATKSDKHGHVCATTTPSWVEATNQLPLQGDDMSVPVGLPFPVSLYGQAYRKANVATNGYLSFTSTAAVGLNYAIPSRSEPNAAVYALWDDLAMDAGSSVRTVTVGTAPDRRFVVEWRDMVFTGQPGQVRVGFEIVFHEGGRIVLQYKGTGSTPLPSGASATVGIENEDGTEAVQYSTSATALADGTAIVLRVPDAGLARGVVTDANDGKPVPDAEVSVSQAGFADQTVRADAEGVYQARVRTGEFRLSVGRRDYQSSAATLRLGREGEIVHHDVPLRTGRMEVQPGTMEIVVPQGESRKRTISISNSGSADVAWQTKEAGGGALQPAATAPLARTAGFEPNARTSKGLAPTAAGAPAGPASPGQVLRQWPVNGLQLGWGVGYSNGVWMSDAYGRRNGQFGEDGSPGRIWPTPWVGDWGADMAAVPGRGLVCQLNVGGDNGIHCWNPATGEVAERIVGGFPWTRISQRGLAYRSDDDSFYVGGWNEGVIYHIRGLSHADRGTVIGRCSPADPAISGLAWNNAFGILWAATNSDRDTMYGLNPDTCQTLKTIAPPDELAYTGGGLETDALGNLWAISQGAPSTAYLIDSGVPDFNEVPWLRGNPEAGTIAPGKTVQLTVEVDAAKLRPGLYSATVVLLTNSGRTPNVLVPIRLVVPAYQVGVNAGGAKQTDGQGDTWVSDQAYTAGGFGYLGERSSTVHTRMPIAGATEPELYRRQRQGAYEYRFDNVPNGTYAVELKFAELRRTAPNSRLFDVISEDTLFIPALDIANTVGSFTALDRTIYVKVTDGQLNLRLISRKGDPVVNAVRITERPDRTG